MLAVAAPVLLLVTSILLGTLTPAAVLLQGAGFALVAIGWAALRSNPLSAEAQDSLFEAFRAKIALLQDTVALINEVRKGNQAEAARIADGMNKS